MASGSIPLHSFNAGEISKIALARVDLAKLRIAAETQVNWCPLVVGPMMLRPGMTLIAQLINDSAAKLIPFVFSKLDTALILLIPNTMYVIVNDRYVGRVPIGSAIADSTFQGTGSWSTGDTTSGATVTIGAGLCTMTCTPIGGLARIKQTIAVAGGDFGKVHGIKVLVSSGPVTLRAGTGDGLSDLVASSVLDTGSHSLTCTPHGDIFLQIDSTDSWDKTLTFVGFDNPTSGIEAPFGLPTPWGASDLANIRFDQSGDEIFVACYGIQQRVIQRWATNAWSVTLYKGTNGPLFGTPTIIANLTPSVYYGNGTLTSDRPFFQSSHVGALFQLFSNGQFNQVVLGNNNAFSNPVRVSGVGTVARNYTWTVSGTWAGRVTLQRSFDGPVSGFTDVTNRTTNGTLASNTGTGSTPDLDNIISWERVGFKGGDYTSGSATVLSNLSANGGYGICRVTGYNSPTSVNIQVEQPFATLSATTIWREGQWSAAAVGFPTSVCFHEGRLWWFGQGGNIWGSQSDNFTGFANQDSNGNALGDSGALNEILGSGDVDTISWGLSLLRLLFGRERSIGAARSSSFDEPMTPTVFSVKDCSTNGADRLPAVKIDQKGVFVQQSHFRVFELYFKASSFDYAARDLTRLNLDIGQPGFVDIAVSRQPDTQIFLVRSDGMCAVLLNDEDDDVVAWWRIMTAGKIENVVVLPSNTNEDYVYFIVNRTIDGISRRFIERLALRSECVGGQLNKQADCAVVYSGSPVSTVLNNLLPNTAVVVWGDGASLGTVTSDASGNIAMPGGLSYSNIVAGLGGTVVTYNPDPAVAISTLTGIPTIYNGCPAEVFADGKRLGTATVSGGTIALGNTYNSVSAVLGFAAPFQSAKLAYASQDGTALSKRKRVRHLGLSIFDTHYQGVQFGPDFNNLDPLPLVEDGQSTPSNTIWGEKDLDLTEFPGGWSTDSRICLLAQAPLPVKIGAAVIDLEEVD